jgi:nucleoside-triphosphate--adenylate kinase
VRRRDDDEKIWRSRVERYEEEAGPLTRWAQQKGIEFKVSGSTSDEIYPQIEAEVLRRFGENSGIGIEEKETVRLTIKPADI